MSPMCQYSGSDGMPSNWHMVHLGTRASGGAGIVMMEATAVTPAGRISPWCLGIWSDKHSEAYLPITNFIKSQGAIPAIQLAHAGRKASTNPGQYGGGILTSNNGGWQPVGPSEIPYDKKSLAPKKLSTEDISQLVKAWATAAQRSLDAGFQIIELHFAHGYLNHEFLSEKSNKRNDQYGGPLENRARFSLEIIKGVRSIWPDDLPLLVRISADEYIEDGFDINQSMMLLCLMNLQNLHFA